MTGIDADASRGVTVQSRSGEEVKAKWLITCGGLQADYVGSMAGGAKGPTVLPFRGTYHELKPEYRNLITRNIYPVPDPKSVLFPFGPCSFFFFLDSIGRKAPTCLSRYF